VPFRRFSSLAPDTESSSDWSRLRPWAAVDLGTQEAGKEKCLRDGLKHCTGSRSAVYYRSAGKQKSCLSSKVRDEMATAAAPADLLRRVVRLQVLTIAWMTVEAIVALAAAWTARSPALLGFGGDSAIELFSAIVVLWRFRSASAGAEKLAARVAGGLLFIVAAFVIATSGLSLLGYREPQPSFAGVILLIVAAIGMPWLANRKRKLATQFASASLRADATESALCGYLSLIALAGLLANVIFHAPWADPIAALALVPLLVKEGWGAIHASRHCCQ
jgi:divalent metal cation (Fe/Co/Zn/Cd) transporter